MTPSSGPNKNRMQDEDPDFDLVRAVQSGETSLFREIVERYEGRLYRFALRICGDRLDAEDVVQDTFLNAFRYLKDFRYESRFRNWLYRIAATSCIRKRRKSKFAPDRELSLDEPLPQQGGSPEVETPEWASAPLERLLNEELGRVIHDAILALPEKHRVVLVLRDVEGFATEEAAQILNLTPANVKVRLHRARLTLRDELKAYFDAR